MNKTNNLRAYLRDLYEGIVSKKPDASRNPQNFRSEIEAIRTGGELYEVMDASELPEDAPNGSLALVEGEPIPEAYTVSSVDELPSNAVDGSMAIVPSDSIKGIWSLISNSLTPINKPFEEGFEFVRVPFIYSYNYDDLGTPFEIFQYSNQLTFVGDNTFIEEITASNCDAGDYDNVVFEQSIFYNGWLLFTIEFFADTDDIAFKEWLNANFKRHSGGYSLYTHENGQWVYKCEVV